MKRWMILLLLLLLCCAGCEEQTGEAGEAGEPEQTPQTSEAGTQTLPRMGGTLMLQPLSEALTQYLAGSTPEQAAGQAQHTSLEQALAALQDGSCDILFTGQLGQAEGLEQVAIARDALVFLTGEDNPVTNLSGDQLRAVYTVGAVDWGSLGGTPGAVIACQPPEDSQAGRLLSGFMGEGAQLVQPPRELKVGSSGEPVVSDMPYRADAAFLGCSMFYYENTAASSGSKILSVDGVVPTEDSISSGQYPATCEYYAVFRADEQEGSAVRQLVAFLVSDEGQALVKAAGYVPLRDVE